MNTHIKMKCLALNTMTYYRRDLMAIAGQFVGGLNYRSATENGNASIAVEPRFIDW